MNISSDIIELNDREEFGELLDISIDRKWDLIYIERLMMVSKLRIFTLNVMVSNTLVIIKAESGNVFGGYTHYIWDKSENNRGGIDDYILLSK